MIEVPFDVEAIWMFPKIGVGPPNHPFLIGFSIVNHPFWVFSIYFWKHLFGVSHTHENMLALGISMNAASVDITELLSILMKSRSCFACLCPPVEKVSAIENIEVVQAGDVLMFVCV